MRSHEDLHDEMEKIKTVVEHQAKVWEQARNLLDQGKDVLLSCIVATVDEHSESLQLLSNGCSDRIQTGGGTRAAHHEVGEASEASSR